MSNGGGCFLLIKKTLADILSSKQRGSSTKGKTEKGAGQSYCHSPRHRLLESEPRRGGKERKYNKVSKTYNCIYSQKMHQLQTKKTNNKKKRIHLTIILKNIF